MNLFFSQHTNMRIFAISLCLCLGMASGFAMDAVSKHVPLAHADGAVHLSATAPAGSTPGSSVDVTIVMDPSASSKLPTGVQWDLLFNPNDITSAAFKAAGQAAADAGKTVTCSTPSSGDFRCVVFAFNTATIAKGPLATITVTISSSASANSIPLKFSGLDSSDADGNHLIIDGADASISLKQTTVTDTTPPTVTLSAPTANAALSGIQTITVTATDPDDAVASVLFYLDNTTLLGTSSNAPYSITWDTTSISNGAHAITAKATDSHGNNATSNAVNITVNNTSPSTLNCSASPASAVAPAQVTFTASGNDSQSYIWTVNGGTVTSFSGKVFTSTFSSSGSFAATVKNSVGQTASCTVVISQSAAQPLHCNPGTIQSANINQTVLLNGTGGSGNYTWSAPGASQSSGAGANFLIFYNNPGNHLVTVSDGSGTAVCSVNVISPQYPPLQCSASSRSANLNQVLFFSAIGGNGQYNWKSNGNIASANGSTYSASFSQLGNNIVTILSGDGQSANCSVTIVQSSDTNGCDPNWAGNSH